MRIAFKHDLVAQAIALLIEQRPHGWRGNTKPLLEALGTAVRKAKQGDMLSEKRWPKNDVWLGRNLRRSAAVLRKVCGIEIKFGVDLRESGDGDKTDWRSRNVQRAEGRPWPLLGSTGSKIFLIRTLVVSFSPGGSLWIKKNTPHTPQRENSRKQLRRHIWQEKCRIGCLRNKPNR